ncbi:MAG: response regulator [Thioalkalispiraceae bacterium]|jgi:CheY-like chemotaxis protein
MDSAMSRESPKLTPTVTSCAVNRFANAALEGRRILLAEDNELNRELISSLLVKAGVSVELAHNGRQAIEKLKSCNVDGVIMDICMPDMDGYQATRIIRQQLHLQDLPVIAMTASSIDECRGELQEAGMNDYIAKPVNRHEFFTTLAKWISISREGGLAQEAAHTTLTSRPGLDVEAGLSICQGKEELYLSLLARFRDLHTEFVSEFKVAQTNNDMESMETLSHNLKGVAGNIGAIELHQALTRLNDATRGNQDPAEIDPALTLVTHNLEQVLNSIDQVLVKQEAPEPQTGKRVDLAQITPIFLELARLLNERDTEARNYLDELKECFKHTIHFDELHQIVTQFNNYNFTQASELLMTLAEKLNISLSR